MQDISQRISKIQDAFKSFNPDKIFKSKKLQACKCDNVI